MVTQEYRANRAKFASTELVKFRGSWIAFSADGCRILACGETVELLEQQLAAKGECSQNAVLDWLPGAEDDSLLGAGEWM